MPINIKGLIAVMPEIRKMTALKPKEFCPKIKKCLAHHFALEVFVKCLCRHALDSLLAEMNFV